MIDNLSMNAEEKLVQLIGSGIEIKKIAIGNRHINYAVAGFGPAVLLLHGANIGWGQWYPNISELSRHFTVYALDLPGTGGSGKIASHRLNFERDFLAAVEEFITKCSLSNVHLIGHSLGGWIVLKFALRNKSFINKIVLVSSLGFTDYIPWKHSLLYFRPIALLLAHTVMRPTKEKMRQFLTDVVHDTAVLKQEFVDYFHEAIHREKLSHPFMLINRLVGFLKIAKELVLLEELSQIRHPTLIILGEKDPLIPLAKVSRGVRLIPGARLEIFLNTGHAPFIERSREFNELVINFLRA